MKKKSQNRNLTNAKKNKKDEFYTQLTDIENELRHYKKHFKGKVIYCNCDDPRVSNFFHYFSYRFEQLGIKKLIATCYKNQNADLFSQNDSDRAIYLEYNGDKNGNRIPDPEEIGIKEVLQEKGIKQIWLAERLGKSFNTVNSYAQNRQQPRLQVLKEISEILEVNLKDLIV